jgi:hypothetical protein
MCQSASCAAEDGVSLSAGTRVLFDCRARLDSTRPASGAGRRRCGDDRRRAPAHESATNTRSSRSRRSLSRGKSASRGPLATGDRTRTEPTSVTVGSVPGSSLLDTARFGSTRVARRADVRQLVCSPASNGFDKIIVDQRPAGCGVSRRLVPEFLFTYATVTDRCVRARVCVLVC